MSELELQVGGMTCVHCERAVGAELAKLDGVEDANADAESGRVLVTHVEPLRRTEVERAISDAGYTLEFWPSEAPD